MTPFGFIALIVLVVVLSIIAERFLRRRRLLAETPSFESLAMDVSEDIGQIAYEARENLRRLTDQPDPNLTDKFRRWSTHELRDEQSIRAWVTNLPEPGLRALVRELNEFCRELNFELVWLVDEALGKEPAVRATLREIVVMYCGNCLQAVELQPQLVEFRAYLALLDQIERGRAKPQAKALLEALQKAGLVDPVALDALLNNEDDRRQYIVQQIRQVAAKDPARFKTISAEVLSATA